MNAKLEIQTDDKAGSNLGVLLGILIVFGGTVIGIATDWASPFAIAFFYAFTASICLLCLVFHEKKAAENALFDACRIALVAFLCLLVVVSAVMWSIIAILP